MENLFEIKMDPQQINSISNLGLAHLGDGVYELMCRSYLCTQGRLTVKNLHKETVELVNAGTQARFADKILPHLTENEADLFRRGKNTHSHAAPRNVTSLEYAKATGLETLFGALYLAGQKDRLLELFQLMMEK